jgi:hypothetical protein
MPQVLVVGATLLCPHGGVLKIPTGNPLLTIAGQNAVTLGQEVGLTFALAEPYVVSPCTIENSSGTPSPCGIATPATSGASTLLAIGGAPALLSSASGMAANLTVGPSQWKVGLAGETLVNVSR